MPKTNNIHVELTVIGAPKTGKSRMIDAMLRGLAEWYQREGKRGQRIEIAIKEDVV